MRKNAPRKWLHAILDLLPVILIPVFMIYSHRHTIDSGTIDVPQNQVVDFNQYVHVLSEEYWTNQNSIVQYLDNNAVMLAGGRYGNIIPKNDYRNIPVVANNKYYIHCDIQLTTLTNEFYLRFEYNNYSKGFSIATTNTTLTQSLDYIGTAQVSANDGLVYAFDNRQSGYDNVIISNIECFNLTQMFGSGNEPSIQQFKQWYTDAYYSYTLSNKELLKGTSTITYDDTDIMSQSMYQLYNAVDKYFNMNNIFNMGNVYDWFNLNIFNGNAPIIMYIVWNIALYELVMDLMFLLYALFMWFVDWCKSLIEKTYDTGRGK